MKKLTTLYILLTLLLISCSKDNIEHQNGYEHSYKVFQQFKKESNNSYTYKTTSTSWTGFTTEYTFEIINGIVHSRSFAYIKIGQINQPQSGWTEETAKSAFKTIGYTNEEINQLFNEQNHYNTLQWKESYSELGSKETLNNIWTLDEIYKKAKTEWLIDRSNTNVYFETKNKGLISQCGYVDQNCQDDCFVGINIKEIIPLNSK